MPIGQARKVFKEKPYDPRTGQFQADTARRREPYRPDPPPAKENTTISSTRDLAYFHTLASSPPRLDEGQASTFPFEPELDSTVSPQSMFSEGSTPRSATSPSFPFPVPGHASYFPMTGPPPPYRPPSQAQPQQPLQPQQLDPLASNALTAPLPAARLALNLFRGTDTHIPTTPIAERLTLGPAQGSPYYHARATPGITSPFEYNTLLLTRRDPLSLVGSECVTAEIRPNVVLFGGGIRDVGSITHTTQGTGLATPQHYSLSWIDKTGSSIDGTWTLYCDSKAICHMYPENGWTSLDDDPPSGRIRIKQPVQYRVEPVRFRDPRSNQGGEDLAILDFSYTAPLFVSDDPRAHVLLDVIVAALFMMMVVATRHSKKIQVWTDEIYQHTGYNFGVR